MEEAMEVVEEEKKTLKKKKLSAGKETVAQDRTTPVVKPVVVSYASAVAEGKKDVSKEFEVVKRKERKVKETLKDRKPVEAFIAMKGDGTTEEARNRLWKNIVSKVQAPKLSMVRVLPRGDVLVKPADEATRVALQNLEREEKSGLKAEVAWKPKVLMYDVERSMKADGIGESLARQNSALGLSVEEMRAAFRPIFMRGPREDQLVRWVCEVDPRLYGKLVAKKWFVGMSYCKVVDFSSVLQCFACHGFGHAEAKCRRGKVLCSHCGEEGHRHVDCVRKDKAPKCVNCGLAFTAGHGSCPVRKRYEKTVLVRTDFDPK